MSDDSHLIEAKRGHCDGCEGIYEGAPYDDGQTRTRCPGLPTPDDSCARCHDDKALLCPTCAVMVNKETP